MIASDIKKVGDQLKVTNDVMLQMFQMLSDLSEGHIHWQKAYNMTRNIIVKECGKFEKITEKNN